MVQRVCYVKLLHLHRLLLLLLLLLLASAAWEDSQDGGGQTARKVEQARRALTRAGFKVFIISTQELLLSLAIAIDSWMRFKKRDEPTKILAVLASEIKVSANLRQESMGQESALKAK